MKLTKLELFGFKSFADRTEFVFDSGITGIVGPNGCGKSNLVDAVKWVLGEQSPKSLRGREMTDIIFSGSASRSSLGYAEAALTFTNGDASGNGSSGSSSEDPLAGAAEIEVRRRLHRSGESEYFLNRRPCRLRDIRELFMNTGIGVDAYSLIEQGKVDLILQGSPQDRRVIFEEAAGISKYRSRRKEAQRKLDRAEQNLLRLSDIISEIQRRLRSIKYQAGKARSYRKYRHRLKELRLSYSLNEYQNFQQAYQTKAAQIASARSRQSAQEEKTRQLRASATDCETRLAQLQGSRREFDERVALLRGRADTLHSEIAFNRKRIVEAAESTQRQRAKLAELATEKRDVARTLDSQNHTLETLSSEIAHNCRHIEDMNSRVAELADATRAVSQDAEQKKGELIDLLHAVGEQRNRATAMEAELRSLAAQGERFDRRRREIATAVERLAGQMEALEQQRDEAHRREQSHKRALEIKRTEEQHCSADYRGIGDELARARELRSGLQSRRQLLDDLQRRGEGVNAAVRQVLAWNGEQEVGSVRGMLADLLDVDVNDAPIIESALGERQQMLVFDRFEDIQRMIEEIGAQLKGRVQCIALDTDVEQSDGRDIRPVPGAVGWAADMIRAESVLQPVVRQLLARTIVTRTLADGKTLAAAGFGGYRYVTVNQQLLEADGTVVLGLPAPDDAGRLSVGLILRRSELREVEAKLADVEADIEGLAQQYDTAASRLKSLQADQMALHEAIRESGSEKTGAAAEIHQLTILKDQWQSEAPLLESELKELDRSREELAGCREAVLRQISGMQARCGQKEEAIKSLSARLAEMAQKHGALQQNRSDLQVSLAQLREKQFGVQSRCADLEAVRARCAETIRQGEQELALTGMRSLEAEREALQAELSLTQAYAQRQSAEEDAVRLADDMQAGRDSLDAIRAEVEATESARDALQSEIHARELEIRELQTKREDLVARVLEGFAEDLAGLYESYKPEDMDWETVAGEIQELRGKIQRLGNVNLESIDEQDELQKRDDFLTRQKEDLESAGAALGRLIRRIDATSREKFLETFEAVRANFQDLFRKLFGGGRADIVLEDEEHPLECGLEIVAKPPGKELQRISLLSGGEKAIAAIALLLAIYRAKPSPFCILDEVDAALDEANTERFTSVIQDFADDSQFIIVTHNKRTMAIAETLYGLTMEEAGISRKISLQFNDRRADSAKREPVKA
ncbi:MAG: chromosome segregation protein SMC [Planctomycetia bacterium]|nr:chromosome segregation protein SMC [Planctomycetia bacterium]